MKKFKDGKRHVEGGHERNHGEWRRIDREKGEEERGSETGSNDLHR